MGIFHRFIYVVPGAGFEPACLSAGNFKSPVSTSFTTRAKAAGALQILEAEVGIEPAYTALQAAA